MDTSDTLWELQSIIIFVLIKFFPFAQSVFDSIKSDALHMPGADDYPGREGQFQTGVDGGGYKQRGSSR